MEKKIEFKNVKLVNEVDFITKPSADLNKMIMDGEIVFTTKHPEEVKRAEIVFSIPKIEIDLDNVKEIADKINQDTQKWDYYYSIKMEGIMQELAVVKNKEYTNINVCIDNVWYVITTSVHHGEKPLANYDDLVFIGTTIGFSNNFVGTKEGAIRKSR